MSITVVHWFQSLFWWISLLGNGHVEYVITMELMFQSLFWWISLLGFKRT